MTRAELEELLGPAAEYVYVSSDLPLLRQWAKMTGLTEPEVALMNGIALTNLYHAEAGRDSASDDLHRMFIRIMEAISVPGFNIDLTRAVAIDTMRNEFDVWSKEAAKAIDAAIAAMPPRIINVTHPNGAIVRLDGPMHYRTPICIQIASLAHAIMLVGPAGCGKTTIGEHVSRALQLPFYITSTINDTHELSGFVDGYGVYHTTPFRQAFENGGLWVADEIDAWDASALLAANSALANGYSVFPDKPAPVSRHPNFRMVATANTYGNGADRVYIGRNELDAASLDRFATINVDYDLTLEQLFANGNQRWLDRVWQLRKIVTEKKIRHVVSSRAIAMGAAALASGIAWNEVEEIYLFKGMNASDRSKCK